MEINIKIPDIDSLPFFRIHQEGLIKGVRKNGSNFTVKTKYNQEIPKGEGVYLLYDFNKALIYIGQSEEVSNRVRTHPTCWNSPLYKEDSLFLEISNNLYFCKVLLLPNSSDRYRIAIEHFLIDYYKPKYMEIQ